jgi:gliding motility-associated-like protein
MLSLSLISMMCRKFQMMQKFRQPTIFLSLGLLFFGMMSKSSAQDLNIVGASAYCASSGVQGFYYVNVVQQFPEFGTADGWYFEWEPAAFIDEPTGEAEEGQGINLINATGDIVLEVMAVNPDGDTLYGTRSLSYFDTFTVDAGPDLELCTAIGEALQAIPSDPGNNYTYEWQPGFGLDDPNSPNPTLTTNQNMTYTVTAWSMLGGTTICEASTQVSVEVLFPPFDLGPNEVACEGEVVTLASGLSGSIDHNWSLPGVGNGPIVDLTTTQMVHLTATSPEGCVQEDSVLVTFSPGPEVDLGPEVTGCSEEGIVLDATPMGASIGPFFYAWSDGGTGGPTHTVHASGEYSVVVTDVAGCPGGDAVVVTALASPSFDTPTDTTFCFEDFPEAVYQIFVPAGYASYAWSSGESGPAITVNGPGVYSVEVTNSVGCAVTTDIAVEAFCAEPLLYVPSAFTPDGNQLNEVWRVEGRNLVEFELFVADRWGQILWQTNSLGDAWNGTGPGGEYYVDQGVYMWRARYRYMLDPSGVMSGWEEQSGQVVIIR